MTVIIGPYIDSILQVSGKQVKMATRMLRLSDAGFAVTTWLAAPVSNVHVLVTGRCPVGDVCVLDGVAKGVIVLDISETESAPQLKVERAYDDLKRLIITLKLAPGDHIDERDLMATLGIGRTPLREAVMRLVHERLITHAPRRGAWVSPLSITDLRQMIEARVTLETHIAVRAAERVTERDIATLQDMLNQASQAVDEHNSEDVVELDFKLHCYIARCSANTYFAAFSEQLNSAMLRYWHLSSQNVQTLPTWGQNHRELVQAIASGDPNLAEEQARRHVLGLRELVRDLIM